MIVADAIIVATVPASAGAPPTGAPAAPLRRIRGTAGCQVPA